jgi:arylsulfatase A-like enzyme
MAQEGTVLTDFYAAANLCTPSRAALLTGRYAVRTGLAFEVIMPGETRGLAQSEVTIAEALKPEYTAALIGKWHLGQVAPGWPPTAHGFDLFYGVPYSHDMLPLSLFEIRADGAPTKEEVNLEQLQQQMYARAERFIVDNRTRPFYLELALTAPHLPNYPHAPFSGESAAGAYGDVVEEIDSIMGRLLAKLKELGLDRDTLVLFTSDNGPWYEGSSGGLRQRKGGAGYDGGYRVPFVAWQPGAIPAGHRVNSSAMSIDFLPTFCHLAGKPLPSGVLLDGLDITQILTRGAASPHDQLLLFDNEDVVAIRTQRWKYVAADYYRSKLTNIEERGYPQLYDMQADISENYSSASSHPDVLAEMKARLRRAREAFAPLKSKDIPEFFKKSGNEAPHQD